MLLEKETQIFNMLDTNGRRSDVAAGLKSYLQCLDKTYKELDNTKWGKISSGNFCEFLFYQKAIEESSDVLKEHQDFDEVCQMIENAGLKTALDDCDAEAIWDSLKTNKNFTDKLDKYVEHRARNYTNSLVKIGFVDKSRQFMNTGIAVMNDEPCKRDKIEDILPLDNVFLVYLRQLLKMKIFAKDGRFYSPVLLAIYVLLHYNNQVSQSQLIELIQAMSPYFPIDDLDEYLDDYISGKIVLDFSHHRLPEEFKTDDELSEDIIKKYLTNQRSGKAVNAYVKYYHVLYRFVNHKTQKNLNALIDCYLDKKNYSYIKSAFGHNRVIYNTKHKDDVKQFLDDNKNNVLLKDIHGFNQNLYHLFWDSKSSNLKDEYMDTTVRMLKLSGVFKFKNGFVELEFYDVFKELFKYIDINSVVFGKTDQGKYDKEIFGENISLLKILNEERYTEQILSDLNQIYGTKTLEELRDKLSEYKQNAFKEYIETNYSKNTTIETLEWFKDKSKKDEILKRVNPDTDVPTAFEYMVGIAWYYLSDKTIDLLNSYNLSLNADFQPETHAGGGEGDIVIESDYGITMLEVTLMDTNSQKRGEQEPVQRHTINLTANYSDKTVLTFFIANELDPNTVTSWHAAAREQWVTSDGSNREVDGIEIMPIKTDELIRFLNKDICAETLFHLAVDYYKGYIENISARDKEWRETFVTTALESGH